MAKGNALNVTSIDTNYYTQFCRLQPSMFDVQHMEGLQNRRSSPTRLQSSPVVMRDQSVRKHGRTQVAWSVITSPLMTTLSDSTRLQQANKLYVPEVADHSDTPSPFNKRIDDASNLNKDNQPHLNPDLKSTFRNSQVINIQLNPLTRNARKNNSFPDLPRGSNSKGFYMSNLNNNSVLPLSANMKSNEQPMAKMLSAGIKPLCSSSYEMARNNSYRERILMEETMLKIYDKNNCPKFYDVPTKRREVKVNRSRKHNSVAKSQSKYVSSSYPYSPLNSKFLKHQSKSLQNSKSGTNNETLSQRINSSISAANLTNTITSRDDKPRHADVKYRVSFAKSALDAKPNNLNDENNNAPLLNAGELQWPPSLLGSKLRESSRIRSQSARLFQESTKVPTTIEIENIQVSQYPVITEPDTLSTETGTHETQSSNSLANANQVVPNGAKVSPRVRERRKKVPPSFRINSLALRRHKAEKETNETPEEIIMRKSVEKVKRWIENLPIHFQTIHHVLPPVQQDY